MKAGGGSFFFLATSVGVCGEDEGSINSSSDLISFFVSFLKFCFFFSMVATAAATDDDPSFFSSPRTCCCPFSSSVMSSDNCPNTDFSGDDNERLLSTNVSGSGTTRVGFTESRRVLIAEITAFSLFIVPEELVGGKDELLLFSSFSLLPPISSVLFSSMISGSFLPLPLLTLLIGTFCIVSLYA